MFDDCISKNVIQRVPFNWNKLAAKLLQFLNYPICIDVAGKQANRGAGFDLEIPVNYIFLRRL